MNAEQDLGLNPSKRVAWSKQIHQKLQDVIKKKKPSDKVAALHKVEPELQVRWVYNNAAQERKAKEDLLQLWKYLIKEVPNTTVCTYLDRPTFFKAIVYISRRHEWDLSKITWGSDMKPSLNSTDQKLIVQYYEALAETNDFCLTNLCKTGVYSSIIDFASKTIALNYFQFTKFADMVADSIWPNDKYWAAKKQDKQLAKDIKTYAKPKPEKFNEPSISLDVFEKAAAYFTALETHKIIQPFKTNKPRQNWMKRFDEEGANFHKFLSDLIFHVLYLFGEDRDKIEWTMLPHYQKLLGALVFQLKLKYEIAQWRKKPVLECICMFLHNEKLLNLFIKVLYSKTNVYDVVAAEAALDVMGDWFKVFLTQHGRMPKEFDYDHFYAGLNILLDSDHHIVLAKSLILIYNYNELFLGKGRVTLVKKMLLQKNFWRLFLHWNIDIRDLFIQLVVYKMVREEGQHELFDSKPANVKREVKLDQYVSKEIGRRIGLLRKKVDWENTRQGFIDHYESTRKQAVAKSKGLQKKKGRAGIRVLDPDLLDSTEDSKEKEKEGGKEKGEKDKKQSKENGGKAGSPTTTKASKNNNNNKGSPKATTDKQEGEKEAAKKKTREKPASAVNLGEQKEKDKKKSFTSKKAASTSSVKTKPAKATPKGEKETPTTPYPKRPEAPQTPRSDTKKESPKSNSAETTTTTTTTEPNSTKEEKGDNKEKEGKEKKKGTKGKKKEKKKNNNKGEEPGSTSEKEKKGDDSDKGEESDVPFGGEVYASMALYRYEMLMKEKQDFLRNPDKNSKGIYMFPAVKYQGLVMAGMNAW